MTERSEIMPTERAPASRAAMGPGGAAPELRSTDNDTLAAVDVGTNSLHLVVARAVGDAGFEVIGREKEMIRLGHGGGDMKSISVDAMARAVVALRRFASVAAISGAPMRAVATSAVREAHNGPEFVALARQHAGVDIEVISGVEEARLIHLGVLQAVDVFDRQLLLCDIGGGSTELLLGLGTDVRASRSFKVGAVRLTDRFFPDGAVNRSQLEACRAFVRSAIAPFRLDVDEHRFEVFVGSSGTIESVARMVHAAAGGEPLRSYNGFRFGVDDLARVVSAVTSARTSDDRRAIVGLDAKRFDIIVAGAVILEQVVESFGVGEVMLSDYALREGVLLDTLQRRRGGSLHHLRDLSRTSVRQLLEQCDDEIDHATQVARLALELFDQTRLLHGLDDGCREYLEAGALLANVGLVIAHSRHHLHSYYVIRNSERLAGFTDNEIEVIALVARYHRKSAPKPTHDEFMALDEHRRSIVSTLAGLLRVAIGLDRSHHQPIDAVAVARNGNRLIVTCTAAPTADVSLELYAAGERRDLLERALGMDIAFQRGEQVGR